MMVEISLIRDCITIFGVIAGFSYYVMTVRATRINQDLQLETRQAQLFSQLYREFNSIQTLTDYAEIMNWQWNDYQDFEMKYGSDNNPQAFAKRQAIWAKIMMIGKMCKNGLIDIDYLYNAGDTIALFLWYKFEEVFKEQRKRYFTETMFEDLEYLVSEIIKYREQIGDPWTPPTTLIQYVLDQ